MTFWFGVPRAAGAGDDRGTIMASGSQGRRSDGRAEPAAAMAASATGQGALLVERDAAWRGACRAHLERLGYQVFEAATAQDALMLLMAPRPFDLVLLGLDLGEGISGAELLDSLDRIVRVPPVLAMGPEGTTCDGAAFIASPFSAADLEARIRLLQAKSAR